MTDRSVPAGYEWPGPGISDDTDPHYWLAEQAEWSGATPLFMVCGTVPHGQTILAERCYLKYGVQIVDALRAVTAAPRVAQLEKIAELARPVVTRYETSPWEQDLLLLHLALIDLDNHPLTRRDNQ